MHQMSHLVSVHLKVKCKPASGKNSGASVWQWEAMPHPAKNQLLFCAKVACAKMCGICMPEYWRTEYGKFPPFCLFYTCV